jgi:hypothetical protein
VDEEKLKQKLSYWLSTYWRQFDRFYVKPKLIHNWPQVADDHEEIANGISKVMEEFHRKRQNKGKPEIVELKDIKSNHEDEQSHH